LHHGLADSSSTPVPVFSWRWWRIMCVFRFPPFLLQAKEHIGHLNGFSPVWTYWCICRAALLAKFFWHVRQNHWQGEKTILLKSYPAVKLKTEQNWFWIIW
jgi:hypothetical protein